MKFKNAITRGGNAILPEIIDVSSVDVTWKKRNKSLISSDSVSIPINSISSVEIDTSIVGTTIKIYSQGQGKIIATNFTASDSKEIKRLINLYKDDLSNKNKKDEDFDDDDDYDDELNQELKIKQFEEEKYQDIDRIPLITFTNDADSIVLELNKLNSLLKHSINEKDQNKSVVYLTKIKEGIRLLETIELNTQQKQLLELTKQDLHEIIIQNQLFEGLKISKDNSEKFKTILHFLLRYKWWTLFILALLYSWFRN